MAQARSDFQAFVQLVDGTILRTCRPALLGVVTVPGEERIPGSAFPELVKGFRGRAGKTATHENVKRIELVCQSIDAPEAITLEAGEAWGPATGNATSEEVCPGRSAMTALQVGTTSTNLGRLGGLCKTVQKNGTQLTPSFDIPLPGHGLALAPTALPCPSGRLLVGLDAFHDGTRFNAVRGICADITTYRTQKLWANLTNWLGPQIGSGPIRLQCPAGRFMAGWTIDTTTTAPIEIRRLQLVCRPL